MVNLKKYYLTKHWKSLSRKVRIERKLCEKCGSIEELHVHHLSYKRLYHERLSDLQVLCKHCHLKGVHKQLDEMDMLDV